MDASEVVNLGRGAVMTTLLIAAPVLTVGFVVALIVSLIQAITQVQEQTLSFIPKIAAMLLAVVVFGPWMLAKLMEFSQTMFSRLP